MDNGSIIITGGNGFVGRHLISELQQHNSFSRINVFDRNVQGLPEGVEGHSVDLLDIATMEDLITQAQPVWVIHLAAIANVGFSIEHPELTRTVNVFGTKALLDTVLRVSPRTRFLVVSSADIYGHVGDDPIAEMPLAEAHPVNPYAESKLEMERMIEREYAGSCIRVRPFPHIGPGQQKGFVTADFASQIAAIEKGLKDPIVTVGNLTARRDFTDVRDVVRAYQYLLEKGTLGDVYHVATGVAHSIQSVLDGLLAMTDVQITVEQDPSRMRPSDTPVLVGDAAKVRTTTGWSPRIPFQQSLQDILDDWRSRT